MLGRTERQMEETSTRPCDRPGGDAWSVPTLRPSILLAGVNRVMTRFDHGVPAAANPECKHVSSMSWRGVPVRTFAVDIEFFHRGLVAFSRPRRRRWSHVVPGSPVRCRLGDQEQGRWTHVESMSSSFQTACLPAAIQHFDHHRCRIAAVLVHHGRSGSLGSHSDGAEPAQGRRGGADTGAERRHSGG